MSAKRVVIIATAAAAVAPLAAGDGYPSLKSTSLLNHGQGVSCFYSNGVAKGEGRAFLGFTLGAAGVPRTAEIGCPELDAKKMFTTVFRKGVVQEFTLGAPNKRKDSDWVFKDPPPAGTGMDPLRKLNASYYDRQLTLLRVAASKVDYNPAKLRRAIVKAEDLRASGRDGDITADKMDEVCEAAMRGIKAKCPLYEDLCDEFRSISQEAVDAADRQRPPFQRAGKYLVISL
ncbi:hypothetical protein FOZ62_019437 [Perkinsus olseni]|uniref:Uncharacterized protein n=2 Tax=Perkinsus olseni TaxID=32597 RepID=A0A7J6U0R4_PEROL|nr:hypothetical protein FOZ62_019437 [Perkinsus olseni]